MLDETIATPRGNITIRTARAEDAVAYRELRLEALRDHPEVFSSDYAENLARPLSSWRDALQPERADRTVMLFFAEQEGQLVGMCGVAREHSVKVRHSATIISMYMRPAWRGLGIAAALVGTCVEWARTHGVTVVKLAVVTTNAAAIRCYARCGFRVYGIEPQTLCLDGVCYDELLMERTV
jgi:RimJ/RimL family protein N-acetyltransferase